MVRTVMSDVAEVIYLKLSNKTQKHIKYAFLNFAHKKNPKLCCVLTCVYLSVDVNSACIHV